MTREKASREPVTHDDLIALFKEHQRTDSNASRNKWECKFTTAINEARGMGGSAVGLLTDLRNLTDPETNRSICPPSLEKKLDRTIAQLAATMANKDRKQGLGLQQPLEARA